MSYPILSCSNAIQLAEFVAHMVPKIWAGSSFTTTTTTGTARSNSFRLFCQNMIKSTQVSSPCVLVALLYIYKLRTAYPSIRASMGSEVRLFTTALILANKFLDDNTFTNKSWSEVSSVPLVELNIMEMEFLSALNYKTFVRQSQFFSWAAQCQQWMSELKLAKQMHRKLHEKKRSANYHPYSMKSSFVCYQNQQQHLHPRYRLLHPSSSSVAAAIAAAAAANSVAAAAAASAMNNPLDHSVDSRTNPPRPPSPFKLESK
ncbi:cyclin-domain-containing protein [Parasitella parasitica]|nr:cyclin-domain-containing protein [Parasitella parasitica]